MELRSFSSERGQIEDDDIAGMCGVTGGVEVEVEDGGVHPPLDRLGIDDQRDLIDNGGEKRSLDDRVDLA